MKIKNLQIDLQPHKIGIRNYGVGITSNIHKSKLYKLTSKLTTGYVGQRNYNLYTTTKTRHQDLLEQLTSNRHKPTAYVEIVNKDTQETISLHTCTDFSTQSASDEVMGEFSCNVVLNDSVDVSVFDSNPNNYINIYFGQNIDSVIHYVKIFTGLISRKSNTNYQFGKVNNINISGNNLSYILHKMSGIYHKGNFHGTSKDLVEMYLTQAGINYKINYTDPITINQAISYKSALSGINTIKNLIPYCEVFVDSCGVFVIRQIYNPSDNEQIQNNEFQYNNSNMFNLKKEVATDKITTTVIITGMNDICSGQWSATDEDINNYGVNQITRNDNRIDTPIKAQNLAEALLDIGQKYKFPVYSFDTVLNPYLCIGCVIDVMDDTSSTLTTMKMRIIGISHNYTHSKEHNTNIKCIKE